MVSNNIFGERVRELRLSKKLKQSELGEVVSLSFQAINSIERGRRNTTFENLVKLAKYFDVSTDYLLGVSDVKKRR